MGEGTAFPISLGSLEGAVHRYGQWGPGRAQHPHGHQTVTICRRLGRGSGAGQASPQHSSILQEQGSKVNRCFFFLKKKKQLNMTNNPDLGFRSQRGCPRRGVGGPLPSLPPATTASNSEVEPCIA